MTLVTAIGTRGSEHEASRQQEREEIQRDRDHGHPEDSSRCDYERPVRVPEPRIAAKHGHVFATTGPPIRFRATRSWQPEASRDDRPQKSEERRIDTRALRHPRPVTPLGEAPLLWQRTAQSQAARPHRSHLRHGVVSVPRRPKSAGVSSAALSTATARAATGENPAAAGLSIHSVTKPHAITAGTAHAATRNLWGAGS
jgi:hypothetical protein